MKSKWENENGVSDVQGVVQIYTYVGTSRWWQSDDEKRS